MIASRSPNRFRCKPLFSNDIKVCIFSGAARIEALTVSGQVMCVLYGVRHAARATVTPFVSA